MSITISTTEIMRRALLDIVEEEQRNAVQRLSEHGEHGRALAVEMLPVKLNRRTTRALGRCRFKGGAAVEIDLSAKQWLAEEAFTHPEWSRVLRNVLRHEFAHVCAGIAAGHGPVWRRWARVLRAEPKASQVLPWGSVRKPEREWRVVCGACGDVLGSKWSRVRPTRALRGKLSRCCNSGNLEISEN